MRARKGGGLSQVVAGIVVTSLVWFLSGHVMALVVCDKGVELYDKLPLWQRVLAFGPAALLPTLFRWIFRPRHTWVSLLLCRRVAQRQRLITERMKTAPNAAARVRLQCQIDTLVRLVAKVGHEIDFHRQVGEARIACELDQQVIEANQHVIGLAARLAELEETDRAWATDAVELIGGDELASACAGATRLLLETDPARPELEAARLELSGASEESTVVQAQGLGS